MRATGTPVEMAALRVAFQHWFGLTALPASVLTRLYNARGAFVTIQQLEAAEGANYPTILTRISRVRDAMATEAVDHEKGLGYRLSEVGLAECREAMRETRKSLRVA